MYDDELFWEAFWTWTRRFGLSLVTLGSITGYLYHQRSHGPHAKTPRQNLAILCDHTLPSSARHRSAEALEKADTSIVPDLIDELAHGDSDGRYMAAMALGLMGYRARAATESMIGAIHDESPVVRRQVARSLGRIADPSLVASSIEPMLHDPDAETRAEAFESLGAQQDAGIEVLVRLVENPDADVRRRAAAELGRSENRATSIAALRGLLDDSEPPVRGTALRALCVQGAVGLDELLNMVSDPKLRMPAARLVRDLGAEAEPTVPALRELLTSDDSDIVIEAANILAAIGPGARDAALDLTLCAVDLRPGVSHSALGALRRIGWESQSLPPTLWKILQANRDGIFSLFLDPEQFRPREPAPAAMADPRPRYRTTNEDLAHLASLRYLRVLELSHTNIHDSGLAHLAGLDQLTWLSLSNTRITSHALAHLANLHELRWLDLSHCTIDDDGLRHLKNLLKLESLSLAETQVSDAGLGHLTALTGLRRLDLKATTLTRSAVDELRASRPDVNIVWQDSR